MKLIPFGLTAALLTMGLASAPAFAQERDNHRREAAREAQQQGRAAQPAPSRSAEQSRPRREEAPRVQAPVAAPPAAAQTPRVERRDEAARVENRGSSTVVGRSVPRTTPSYDRDRVERWDRERYDRDRRAYSYSPRVVVPRTYYRPYVFRPRVSIGFGIFAGYPVPYAWRYSAPIYVYGYHAPRAPVYITPGMTLYGGVALEMSPYDADVFVDGGYAGKVADFDGTTQPLTLMAGTHRIEVQAPGYAPLVFDVVVEGGQVIPYRGDLRPY
jgi:PEGA domain